MRASGFGQGPLVVAPTLARPVWGGTTLAHEMGKDPTPDARIGESWETQGRAYDGVAWYRHRCVGYLPTVVL